MYHGAALHDTAVAERYGARRHFVRCEGAPSAAAVLTELARVLGLSLVGRGPCAKAWKPGVHSGLPAQDGVNLGTAVELGPQAGLP